MVLSTMHRFEEIPQFGALDMNIQVRKTVKAALFVAGLLCSSSAYAQTGPWQISEVGGQVFVGKSGVSKAALKGGKLKAGDTVKTGRNGRAVLTRGEQYMVVSPKSHIRIAEPKKDGYLTQVYNYFGNVLFKVDRRKSKHFEVKTPYMAAVVKGTTFNVAVGAEGATVQVTEGAVEVATLDGGATQLLTPGMIGSIERNNPLSLNVFDGDRREIRSPNKVTNKVPAISAIPQRKTSKNAAVVSEIVATPDEPRRSSDRKFKSRGVAAAPTAMESIKDNRVAAKRIGLSNDGAQNILENRQRLGAINAVGRNGTAVESGAMNAEEVPDNGNGNGLVLGLGVGVAAGHDDDEDSSGNGDGLALGFGLGSGTDNDEEDEADDDDSPGNGRRRGRGSGRWR